MSYRFTRQRVRIEVDVSQKDAAIFDRITGRTPRFARSAAVQFEVALLFAGELVDISNISAAQLTVKPATNRSGTAEMNMTIGVADMNPQLTLADWQSGAEGKEHFRFTFASGLTGIGTGDLSSHWLVLHGLTSDDALDVDVFGAGPMEVFNAGIAGVTSPAPAAEGGITLSQATALLANYLPRVLPNGTTLMLPNNRGAKRILGLDDDGNRIDSIEY
jgi:hypothetical protein